VPRRDVTLTDKFALLEKIKNQPPNTSHQQLEEITVVPKSTIAHVTQQQEKLHDGHYATDNRELPKKGRVKVRNQVLKRLSISGSLS
jgi:hypothetical protein